jgi:hypothetical protein
VHEAPLVPPLVKDRTGTRRFFLAITKDTATPCSVDGKSHRSLGRRCEGGDCKGTLVYEMVDSIQPDEPDYDKVDGNDVIQQARQNQN